MAESRLALDRASVRRTDQDGHLHIAVANISKAAVNPYYGREIPDFERLGLEPDRIYQLLRHPDELAKAAPTFAGKPLLSKHVPQTADDHGHEITVGAVGNEVVFEAPYLKAPLVVWERAAIDGIESGEQRELSSAYRYEADFTPGEHEGVRYDAVMRNIRANHVAVVSEGRAGPDVVVGDSALPPSGDKRMTMRITAPSRRAVLAAGALHEYLRPKLAADMALDTAAMLKGVTAKNWKASKPKIKAALDKALAGKLAEDADIEDVVEMLDRLDDVTDEIADVVEPTAAVEPVAADNDAETLARLREVLKAKGMSDEDIAAVCAALNTDAPAAAATPAQDTDKDDKDVTEKKPEVTKAAMDAAIAAAARAAEQSTIARLNGIREAEKAVRPWIGEIAIAQDSAEAVYKLALDSLGVEVVGVHPSAFAAILKAQPKPGDAVTQRAVAPAMDSAAATAYAQRFPNAARLKH